jgi:enterochelin esterase-like enzyme
VYANSTRDLFVYTPANLDTARPANLIVFNDGAMYLSAQGQVRAAQVLDSLHARKEIEATVAIFVNPGQPKDAAGTTPMAGFDAAMTQRSIEYDSLTPDYGRFLLDEVIPFVKQAHDLNITDDPTRRTMCGISSGGICAFTVAWMYAHSFQRVLSHCGSYTNIRGGHNYPYLIRSTPRKLIRVYLQSGANDAITLFGDWPLANQTMANALAYADYDFHFNYGTGGHSLRHAGAVFADSLRWLWRTNDQLTPEQR